MMADRKGSVAMAAVAVLAAGLGLAREGRTQDRPVTDSGPPEDERSPPAPASPSEPTPRPAGEDRASKRPWPPAETPERTGAEDGGGPKQPWAAATADERRAAGEKREASDRADDGSHDDRARPMPPDGERAHLGAVVTDAGQDPEDGLLVERVIEGSLAAREGMLPGDVILSVAAVPITRAADVYRALREHRPGEVIRVRVRRHERPITLRMHLDEGIVVERPGPTRAHRDPWAQRPSRIDVRLREIKARIRALERRVRRRRRHILAR